MNLSELLSRSDIETPQVKPSGNTLPPIPTPDPNDPNLTPAQRARAKTAQILKTNRPEGLTDEGSRLATIAQGSAPVPGPVDLPYQKGQESLRQLNAKGVLSAPIAKAMGLEPPAPPPAQPSAQSQPQPPQIPVQSQQESPVTSQAPQPTMADNYAVAQLLSGTTPAAAPSKPSSKSIIPTLLGLLQGGLGMASGYYQGRAGNYNPTVVDKLREQEQQRTLQHNELTNKLQMQSIQYQHDQDMARVNANMQLMLARATTPLEISKIKAAGQNALNQIEAEYQNRIKLMDKYLKGQSVGGALNAGALTPEQFAQLSGAAK